MTANDFASRLTDAYAVEGSIVDIGRAVLDGTTYPDVVIGAPTAMCNRHGLIAGATGTGKTVTLQVLAEQLSAQGVPVFTADIKGDLTGLVEPADPGTKITERVEEMGLDYTPSGSPVQFWSLGGIGPGVPVRAAIGSFGPQLLAKVIGANETQTSSLSLVFYYADRAGLPLLDLIDLIDLLRYLTSDEGKPELKAIGGLSTQTVGVLLRKLIELDQQGAELFFGEPELTIDSLMRTDEDGRGIISCLELAEVQDRPKLFSTFLMWLLAELFENLPEAGDLDRPKLVFFFDEAHLLFADASKEFLQQVTQTVRLIRSKGVGVFFVTQLPDDVPDEVLAQLGTRVQHALRAHTPRDAKALKAAVTTYPRSDDYDLEQALTQLGTGEAIVTTLDEDGTPTPVAWTKVRPPMSQIGAVDPARVRELAEQGPMWEQYRDEIDRESAREMLAEKMGVELPPSASAPSGSTEPDAPAAEPDTAAPDATSTATPEPPAAPSAGTDGPSADDLLRDSGIDPEDFEVEPQSSLPPPPPPPAPASEPAASPVPEPKSKPKAKEPKRAPAKDDRGGNVIGDFLKSREGRATVNNVVRGVFDLLKGSQKKRRR